ncbi:unnamed protein product [Discula destructiva]
MQCYTELTPPTAVNHTLSLPFLSAQASNLIVAKSSLLQIFETKTITSELDTSRTSTLHSARPSLKYDSRINDDDGLESSFLGGDAAFQRADRANNTKLVLVTEISVSGTVTGLARIRTQNTPSGGEALLVQFKDAKLSLLEWDPQRYNVTTVSIHYYEQEEHQGSPWAPALNDCVNFLTADPGSRCAALKFGARNLAILPFKQADEEDEDVAMDDWDPDLDGPRPVKQEDASTAVVNGTSNIEDSPYSPSFVLRLSLLDSNLIHPVDLAFLYEYREPTFGILSSSLGPSAALGRRDHLSFMVFTLDLQQKASTTILSVGGLPGDLFKVVALPAPVGGALLVGPNELIHIDQSGATNGVGVNPFTKQCTDFTLTDQSDLCLRLEGCVVDFLSQDTSQMLLALADGRLAVLDFIIDGRRVSALQIKLVTPENGGNIIPYRISSLSRVGKNALFAGSEDGDSVIFGWTRKQAQASKKKSRPQQSLDFEEFDEDDMDGDGDDDDDDIYADTSVPATNGAAAAKGSELVFRIHDRLTSIAPIHNITFGKTSAFADTEEAQNHAGIQSELQLVAAVGTGKAGSLAFMNREIQPQVVGRFDFPEARGLWTMTAQKPVVKAQGEKGKKSIGDDYDMTAQYDTFMIVAKIDLDNYETSDVYALTAAGFESLTGTEFEPAAGFTVQAGTMANHRRVIQVLKSEVRVYDGDLGLDMILPMQDEETGAEPRVLHASISDPYLLLIRDDGSTFIAHMNSDDELEEIEKPDGLLTSTKWVSGCLYADTAGVFVDDKAENADKNILMFLLSSSGGLHVFTLPDLSKPVFTTEGLSYIPPILTSEWIARRGMSKESITEILVADLGDTAHKSPHMILRHANNDLTIYEPQINHKASSSDPGSTLFFRKLSNNHFARSFEEPVDKDDDDDAAPELKMPLRACHSIGGYSTVFLPGPSPSFIIKSAKSTPKVLGLQGVGVRTLSTFHTEGCEQGFIYADTEGIARVTQLSSDCTFSELGMSVRKVPLNVDVNSVAYHATSGAYLVGCNVEEEFELPKDDDSNPQQAPFWQKERLPANFKPLAERGSLRLITKDKWTVIDTVELEPCEILMCVESLSLEVSETTKERRELIVVGTAISRGEDLPIRGRIHVYDLASVIPEPGRPETNKKFKLVAKEEIPRGAVTAISGIGNQGFVLVAHGQKCTVRGLKEDGTLLPVAFMDMSNYVTSIKEVPGTGLCAVGDAFKGVWFAGYTEEPYKMMLFGKSDTKLEVLNVDFLPDGKELFIIAADADANLHVLQFDPEHPKSLQGHLLLHRTTFNVGANLPTQSLLLPRVALPSSRTLEPATNGDAKPAAGALPPQILLLASPTGALATLSPLSEASYRRLSSLVSQLITTLPHHAGLNPKAYRMPPSATQTTAKMAPGIESGVGANIVDAAVLSRWNELASGRRGEIAGRVGFAGPDEVRGELEEVLGWSGLSYF